MRRPPASRSPSAPKKKTGAGRDPAGPRKGYSPRGAPRKGPASRSAPAPPPARPPAPRERSRTITLFVATRNPGKARELADLLADAPFRVIGPEQIADFSAPVEDGATFEANARKKAIHYSRLVAHLVLADDSGLEVDALKGQPGVRSARLGGPAANDADRVRLIMGRLEGVSWEQRTARFKCVLAVARKEKVLATFDGEVEGRIAFEPAGAEGFGYDPIFFYPPAGMTFAAMTAAEKSSVSHRGIALAKLVAWLKERARENAREAVPVSRGRH